MAATTVNTGNTNTPSLEQSSIDGERHPTPKASNIPQTSCNTITSSTSTHKATNASTQPQPHPKVQVQQQQQQKFIPSSSITASKMKSLNKRTNEEFKNQLVHDVFGRDNKGRVPMEKVAMLIWQFRDDPAVVQFMAQFVAKVSQSARIVLDMEILSRFKI